MIEEALEHLVRGIVDHPDDVAVDLVSNRRGNRLEVRVHPEDLGRVIGRNGRTAKALRQLVAKSLVVHGEDRYTMLESIRVYAAERLASSGRVGRATGARRASDRTGFATS